jgi:phosphatidate cytidylyltransferase
MMSPSVALHDRVFRAYLCLLVAVLAGAGAVLALLRFVFRKKLGAVWSTYRSWLIMGPLAALAIYAGRAPFIIAVMLVAVMACSEFAYAAELIRDRWMTGVVYGGIVLVCLGSLASASAEPAIVPASVIALILLVPILRNRAQGELQRMSLGVLGFFYLGWMFGHLGFLANRPNAYGYVCFILLATELNDVAAFTFGKILGRHPLRSEISPRKTWEGALGALALSLLLPWLLHFSFPFFGPWQLLLTGLIVGVGGQLGDLSISLIKRDLGTKDMGASIPGHGGILDRIDSLIFTAPLFMHMATYYYPDR